MNKHLFIYINIGDTVSTCDCPLCIMSRDKSKSINLQVIYKELIYVVQLHTFRTYLKL